MKLFIGQLVSFLILPCKKFHPGCVRAWLGCCQHLRMSNYHSFFKIARSTHHCVQTLHQASAHKVRPVGWPAFNPFFNLVCSMLYFNICIILYYVILCYIILCYTILYFIILCYIILYYVMLYYVVFFLLFSFIPFLSFSLSFSLFSFSLPMHILSARLSNFRSFHSDQFLTFGHSNIFVGRNGSGKSSLLSALLSSLLPSAHSSILPNSFVELRISNNNSFAGLPSIFSLSVRFSPSPLYFLDSHPLSSSLFFLICELLGISQSIAIHQSVSSNSDIYPCSINSLGSLSPHSRLNLIINSLGVSNYDIRKLKAIKCLNIDTNTIDEQINERKNELKNEIKKGK